LPIPSRAERRWRQLYDAGEKDEGGRPTANPSSNSRGSAKPKMLKDHGVSYDEAARGAKLAAMSINEQMVAGAEGAGLTYDRHENSEKPLAITSHNRAGAAWLVCSRQRLRLDASIHDGK
jgi:hypothetical protein